MKKILRIEEQSFKKEKNDYQTYDGYFVITDKQTIKLGISNGQSCCETWGYFMTNENIADFVGATVSAVDIVDAELDKKQAPDFYEGGTLFVNLETDKGTLQFTAYNSHNGYYGHEAIVISEQLKHEEYL